MDWFSGNGPERRGKHGIAQRCTELFALALIAITALAASAYAQRSQAARVPTGWSAEGKVIGVNGPIAPESVGVTLPHEHLFINFLEPSERLGYRLHGDISLAAKRFFQEFGLIPVPDTPEKLAFWDRDELDISMFALIRRDALARPFDGYSNKTIAMLDSDQDAVSEANEFRKVGGQTIVDVTVEGLGRQPKRLARVAQLTGVNIVMGTGWYRWPFHDPDVRILSVDALAQRMIDDLTTGVHGTNVRAGIIGELPVDPTSVRISGELLSSQALGAQRTAQYRAAADPAARPENVFNSEELRVLRAGARASRATGAAMTLHYITTSLSPLDIIASEGADLRRVVVGHADSIVMEPQKAAQFLARGVFLELDYGLEFLPTVGPTSSRQSALLDALASLIKAGHADQLLLSNDVCTKLQFKRYGGAGLTWLQDFVLPQLRARGVTEAQIDQITVINPRRLLTFAKPLPLQGDRGVSSSGLRLDAVAPMTAD